MWPLLLLSQSAGRDPCPPPWLICTCRTRWSGGQLGGAPDPGYRMPLPAQRVRCSLLLRLPALALWTGLPRCWSHCHLHLASKGPAPVPSTHPPSPAGRPRLRLPLCKAEYLLSNGSFIKTCIYSSRESCLSGHPFPDLGPRSWVALCPCSHSGALWETPRKQQWGGGGPGGCAKSKPLPARAGGPQ